MGTIRRVREQRLQARDPRSKVSLEREISTNRIRRECKQSRKCTNARSRRLGLCQSRKRKDRDREGWKVSIVRVGTGYRVTTRGKERLLEVGLGHPRILGSTEKVERIPGARPIDRVVKSKVNEEGTMSLSAMQRTSAYDNVISIVRRRESMRPVSVYTGCGRIRKRRRGLTKRKPTKVGE